MGRGGNAGAHVFRGLENPTKGLHLFPDINVLDATQPEETAPVDAPLDKPLNVARQTVRPRPT